MLFEWSEECRGDQSHRRKLPGSFLLFFGGVEGFFHAERFTSTHETLIVGQSVLLSSTSGPPEDFKVKAHINQRALQHKGLRIPTPGQAGDARLAFWPGWTYQNLWNSGPESLAPWCSQHMDSNSDSRYSWICSWHGDTNLSPESPHVFGGKKALMCAQFSFSFPSPCPSLHSGKFNVIKII